MEEKNNNFFTMLLLTIDETCPVFEMMDRIKKKLSSLSAPTKDDYTEL